MSRSPDGMGGPLGASSEANGPWLEHPELPKRSRPCYGLRAIASISTLNPLGSALTATVERAGGGSGKNVA
jgi:hypothetical protein